MNNPHGLAAASLRAAACRSSNSAFFHAFDFFQKTGKSCLAVLVVLLCTSGGLFSQTTTWSTTMGMAKISFPTYW